MNIPKSTYKSKKPTDDQIEAAYLYVRERDKYTCQICGDEFTGQLYSKITKDLIVNHVCGRFGWRIIEIDKMVSLCGDFTRNACHKTKFHDNTKKWRGIMLDKIAANEARFETENPIVRAELLRRMK